MKTKKNYSLSVFRELRSLSGKSPQDCARNLGLMRTEYDRLENHQQGQRYLVLLIRHLKYCGMKKSQLWELLKKLESDAVE